MTTDPSPQQPPDLEDSAVSDSPPILGVSPIVSLPVQLGWALARIRRLEERVNRLCEELARHGR